MNSQKGNRQKVYGSNARFEFDGYEVDPSNRTCVRAGAPLPLSGKVFDVLLAFVESPGRLLTKDEIIDRVWSDEFVEEGNLARNVSTLRKVLGDTEKNHRYIATVPGHGYRFVAEVYTTGGEPGESEVSELPRIVDTGVLPASVVNAPRSRRVFWTLAVVTILFTVAWFGKDRLFTSPPTVKSLAVLPLRGIDPKDNYLGFGISDAVIRRISSSGQVAVRPTSAVLHYLNEETDTLAAARELNVDAILEGNVQRSGDKLRISVNLLRTADSISIWSENFDMRSDDIFRVQDEVAEQVADKLKIRLESSVRTSLDKYPVDQRAYDFYLRGMFSLDQRGYGIDELPYMLNTIDLFEQSIIIEPNYAAAHGQLAFSYAWMAFFIQPGEQKWVDLARQEIVTAEKLDPNVAEAHVASGLLNWSSYGGYQNEAAIKEFRLAKQLNPSYTGADLIALYGHVGLEQQAMKELNRGLSMDPTSQALNALRSILPMLNADVDGWYASDPQTNIEDRGLAIWYFLRKGSLEMAKKILDQRMERSTDHVNHFMLRSLLFALQGNSLEAETLVKTTMSKVERKSENFHHETYFAACVFALDGKSAEAVKWLRETANSGFPNYQLFARDPFLDRIRQSPEFIQFLSEQKTQWEHFEQEFPVEQ